MKPCNPSKEEFLREAAKIEGIYVPSFYNVEYNGDGTVRSVTPNIPEAPERVKRGLSGILTGFIILKAL